MSFAHHCLRRAGSARKPLTTLRFTPIIAPVFIYDAYVRRLLKAAGLGSYRTYTQARMACEEAIRGENFSVREYGRLHGLIVRAGKTPAHRAAGRPISPRSVQITKLLFELGLPLATFATLPTLDSDLNQK